MSTATMTEYPILFTGPMVRSILQDRKLNTRRVMTPRNSSVLGYPFGQLWDHLLWDRPVTVDPGPDILGGGSGYQYLHVKAWNPADGDPPTDDDGLMQYRVRPKWRPGDRLWVKETFAAFTQPHPEYGDCDLIEERLGGDFLDYHGPPVIAYAADQQSDPERWRPSIFMPRWASRITLEITEIRAERVQDISEADAYAEGVTIRPEWQFQGREFMSPEELANRNEARSEFRALWDSINAKRGVGWDLNPRVWVIVFKRVSS